QWNGGGTDDRQRWRTCGARQQQADYGGGRIQVGRSSLPCDHDGLHAICANHGREEARHWRPSRRWRTESRHYARAAQIWLHRTLCSRVLRGDGGYHSTSSSASWQRREYLLRDEVQLGIRQQSVRGGSRCCTKEVQNIEAVLEHAHHRLGAGKV